jgi:DNA-binding MarR family transcriptional regulator
VSARTRAGGKWDHGAVNIETERALSTDGGLAAAEMPLTLYLVKRLELVIRALMDDALRPLGVTTLQYTALTVLESRGPLSSAQLARRSFLRPQTMHEMVLSLEKRGVIAREPQEGNKRILLARLTDEGRDLLAQCNPLVLEIERELLAGLPPEARAGFRNELQHGIAALGNLSATRRATVTGTE